MKNHIRVLLLLSIPSFCAFHMHACKVEQARAGKDKQIQSWIAAQEAEEYAVRASAKTNLLEAGRPAVDAINRALQLNSWSREARTSLEQVAGTLEARLVWDQLTNRPRMNVHLESRSVEDALTEISHTFRLNLHCDARGKGLMRGGKVNLRLSNVDWAETLAALLNRAGEAGRGDEFSCEFVQELAGSGRSASGLRLVSHPKRGRSSSSVTRYCARNGFLFSARLVRGVPALAERTVWCVEVKGVAPSPFGHRQTLLTGLQIVDATGEALPALDANYVRDVPQGVRADTLIPLHPDTVKRIRGSAFKLSVTLQFKWPNEIRRREFKAPLSAQPVAVAENRSVSFEKDPSGQLLWTEHCVFRGQGNEPLPGLLQAFDANGRELAYESRGDSSAAASWPAREVRTVRYRHYWQTKGQPARVVYTFAPGFVVKPQHLVFEGLRIPDALGGGGQPLDAGRILAAF